jgi:outer membrane protein TolC
MKRFFYMVPALLALLSTSVQGAYREMVEAFDAYRPPQYLDGGETPADKARGTVKDESFTLEREQLYKAKSMWEKAVKETGGKEAFFQPAPGLMKSLREAGTSENAAARALSPSFSLETLEALTLLRNPGIKVRESRVRAAIDTFTQVVQLDEILRRYTAFTEDLMRGVGPTVGKEPMKRKFPFPGVLALKGEVVNQDVKAAEALLEMARRNGVTRARLAYWDLLFLHKARKIVRDTLSLLTHLERVATTRYEAGKTSYQDVIKVRIEREVLREELISLKERQYNQEARIREILHLKPERIIGAPLERNPSLRIPSPETLYPLALARKQELNRLRAIIGRTERLIEMAETMILPSFTLGFSFYEDRAVDQVGSVAVRPPFSVSTTASSGYGLPRSPWYGVEDAYLRQTRQKLDGLREALKEKEAGTVREVREGWYNLDLAKREYLLYTDSILQLSRAALDVSSREYETGRVPFADVISSYTEWLKAGLTTEKKRSDLGTARARLEQTIGKSFTGTGKERKK